MQTKYIAIAVGAVVVLGGLWYFLGGSAMAPSGNMPEEKSGSMEEETASDEFTGSIGELAKRGGNYQCTFTSDTADASSSGTVYVAGYQISGEFTSAIPSASMTVKTYMVQDGGYTYIWSSESPMGFKTKITETSTGPDYAPTSGTQVTMGQSYAYKCAPWTVDKGKFSVPSDVEFVEN
ncbi:MAG: hypothetical protein AAB923_02550 [Patescibacteria group bacterium]